MRMFTDEWRQAVSDLTGPLKPYMQHFDMGAARYKNPDNNRVVTIKNRLRKDKVAVVSIGCGTEIPRPAPIDFELEMVVFRTIAMPCNDTAKMFAALMLEFLEGKSIQIATPLGAIQSFMGYEEMDKKAIFVAPHVKRDKLCMEELNSLKLEIIDLISKRFQDSGDAALTDREADEVLECLEQSLERLAGYPDYSSYN